jgi:hypothetical protein
MQELPDSTGIHMLRTAISLQSSYPHPHTYPHTYSHTYTYPNSYTYSFSSC